MITRVNNDLENYWIQYKEDKASFAKEPNLDVQRIQTGVTNITRYQYGKID